MGEREKKGGVEDRGRRLEREEVRERKIDEV